MLKQDYAEENIELQNSNYKNKKGIMLSDDIWGNGALLLRSGAYLTEEIISKLLRFGVKKVNVKVEEQNQEQEIEEQSAILADFLSVQKSLIIGNSQNMANYLTKSLVQCGFDRDNIYTTNDISSINNYFRACPINYIFIEGNFYKTCKKCVEKYSLLKNTHTFVISEITDAAEFRRNSFSKIKILTKPLKENVLNSAVLEALDQNYEYYWNEDELLIS